MISSVSQQGGLRSKHMDCKEIYNDMRSKGIEKDQFKCLVNISIKMDQYVKKKKIKFQSGSKKWLFQNGKRDRGS